MKKIGYINDAGSIQDKFDPKNSSFKLDVPCEFDSIRDFDVSVNLKDLLIKLANNRE